MIHTTNKKDAKYLPNRIDDTQNTNTMFQFEEWKKISKFVTSKNKYHMHVYWIVKLNKKPREREEKKRKSVQAKKWMCTFH